MVAPLYRQPPIIPDIPKPSGMSSMTSNQSLHMNKGEGEASYACNSTFQSSEQSRMKPIVEEAVTSLWKSANTYNKVVIADLGCSSGPNALALASIAVNAILRQCEKNEQQLAPELCVLLNDLPDNDFNNVAKLLVSFQESLQISGQMVTGIVPGSFYKRLFTSSSLHLVLSSNSLHWLSEVPEDLKKNAIPMYDSEDSLREARRPLVLEAYARQFRKDFKLFLKLRSQELAPGGQMVISLPGWRVCEVASESNQLWDFLAFNLQDMASRGVISREKLDSFYIPMYGPSEQELREIIEEESSFQIDKMQMHEPFAGTDNNRLMNPRMSGLTARAALEPIITQHFGQSEEVMDEFVRTVERHMGTPDAPAQGRNMVFLCVSLTMKN